MKLTFLGSGSAFTVGEGNYHSNMLLEADKNHRLLIDCGSDVRLSLNALGYSHRDISDVYVSHLHADHAGGLEWLAFNYKFDSQAHRKPVLHISEALVDILWKNVLSGGLRSLQGVIANLTTYFDVDAVPENGKFTWQHVQFQLIQTVHIFNGFKLVPSFGLMFTVNDKTVLITTDTQFAPHQFLDFYRKADIIFHDCETAPVRSGVHANYNELLTLEPDIKAKMWLYHYNPGNLPDARKDGFRGFVTPGQCFDFANPTTLL